MRLHLHWPTGWEYEGVWAYAECRCGARRTARHWVRVLGPVRPGWPIPEDAWDSRWWPTPPPPPPAPPPVSVRAELGRYTDEEDQT
ncbi:hypothetical protein DNL40_02450 [Xylanimonas oleitrophica]|uniref:Uncharacterized protein n=1 Tax=Xylanimonas oleitrophica TaxID=2607479 RepID=A0A2W5YJA0_9MICO|nr:hypothetical protein [Xylanimonas oleitrophica]PZR55251.1 hypothetical protein DNL40_02450 [Xylanimonas oleitrophica]